MSCDDNQEARSKDRAKRKSLPIARARDVHAPKYWTSAEDRARTAPVPGAANEFAGGTFDVGPDGKGNGVSRRGFVQVASLSTAIAAVGAACRKPHQKIVPFVRRPEEVVPGNPLHFATAYGLEGYASGLLVESHEGRPTKVEGNPAHPQTLGATTSFEQSLTLSVYDDDRAKQIRTGSRPLAWRTFLAETAVRANSLAQNRGAEPALPDRADDVAVPDRSAPPGPRAIPGRQVRQLCVAGRRRRRRGGEARVRQAAGSAPQGGAGQRDSVAGRRLPGRGERTDAAVARVRGAPRAEPADEPPLRGRAGDDHHGLDGRSPAAPAGQRDRGLPGVADLDAGQPRAGGAGAARVADTRAARVGSEVAGRARDRPRAQPRQQPDHRGPPAAGGRSRAGRGAQRRAQQPRQHRRVRDAVDLRRDDGCRAARRARPGHRARAASTRW